ncbi:MAG: hypothetical protein PF795_07955 [Kiritimatiellae bacterium]|jgi:hypothetical protein|nr:hypothetical protein [Kiritimatiellia bacterium]
MNKTTLLSLFLLLPLIHAYSDVKLSGRHLSEAGQHFEFRLRDDNRVVIIPLNEKQDAVAPGDQEIQLTGGDRSAPLLIAFKKTDEQWVSTEALPDVQNMPVVLRVRQGEERPVFFRFQLNRATCGGCGRQEYACSCGHGH